MISRTQEENEDEIDGKYPWVTTVPLNFLKVIPEWNILIQFVNKSRKTRYHKSYALEANFQALDLSSLQELGRHAISTSDYHLDEDDSSRFDSTEDGFFHKLEFYLNTEYSQNEEGVDLGFRNLYIRSDDYGFL